MAIDRIGKGGAPPVSSDGLDKAGGAASADKAGKAFEVERPTHAGGATSVDASPAASGASPLARLRAGEIDVDRYVDLKVDEATASLEGLSATELDDIKKMLRDQMANDPGLSDLVRSATGSVPTPPED